MSCDCNNHRDSPSFSFAKQSLLAGLNWYGRGVTLLPVRPVREKHVHFALKRHQKQFEPQLEVVTPSTTGGMAFIGAKCLSLVYVWITMFNYQNMSILHSWLLQPAISCGFNLSNPVFVAKTITKWWSTLPNWWTQYPQVSILSLFNSSDHAACFR